MFPCETARRSTVSVAGAGGRGPGGGTLPRVPRPRTQLPWRPWPVNAERTHSQARVWRSGAHRSRTVIGNREESVCRELDQTLWL